MRVLLFFIDGLGIGPKDKKYNPCTDDRIRFFNYFSDDSFPKIIQKNGLLKPIDANLGVSGLPQSATGQTALYTGINAAKILSRHLSGFPNQKLREILAENSIFSVLTRNGKTAAFINAYRPLFFEKGPEALIRFLSVTSIMNWKAGLPFFTLEDLRQKRSIYHDFTNRELIRKGFSVPEFSPAEAAKILAGQSRSFDFCLYEFFKTDRAGHAGNFDDAVKLLLTVENFLETLLNEINLSETLLILTSDHGNIEDLSVKMHTTNPVPLMCWGKNSELFFEKINSILDITPAILGLFGISSLNGTEVC